MVALTELDALELFRRTVVTTVRQDSPDLSARQMALLLTVYLTEPPHTVRGMAESLKVSKPAITRALDRLTDLKLIRRKKDDEDRRNVLIQRTVRGSVFLREYGEVIVSAAKQLGIGEPPSLHVPADAAAAPPAPSAVKPSGSDDTWFSRKLDEKE